MAAKANAKSKPAKPANATKSAKPADHANTPAPAKSASKDTATIGFEAKLWLTADKLRNNMDARAFTCVFNSQAPSLINALDTFFQMMQSYSESV